ncbi:MAG TPA: DegQ family serine endoprotease [Desulfatiglandales bacterium]|nr:DegQ family serine endoprotease [Desulfatiglandales bacterium]
MRNQCLQPRITVFASLVFILFLVFGFFQNALAVNGVPNGFSELAEEQGHVAVNISTTKTVQLRRSSPFQDNDQFRYFFGDEFFRRFFGEIPEEQMKQRSLGSGVVVTEDGYILTNNHVVADADEILVTFSENEQYEAKIIGRDPETDIALIKVKIEKPIQAAKLGDSDKLKVGDWVVAIGNPFGFGSTVTAGIVSAKGRVIGAGPYDDFIQTDASINPGNSGGPLFNLDGEVVGINTAIVAPGGGNVGIGFAIPINMANWVMSQLKEEGKVTRGRIGALIQMVTPEIKEKFGLESEEGVLIADVTKDGPSEKGGLKRGDVIISFEGQNVKDMNNLLAMVAKAPIGKKVEIVAIRDGKKKKFTVKIEERKEELKTAEISSPETEESFGLAVQELTPELAKSLSLEDQKGVVIAGVKRGSPAFEMGLERGDLVQEIEHEQVENMDGYIKIMEKLKSKNQILMVVRHQGHTRYVVLKRENN